ncbi:MAG: metallophosphoesterase [Acidobacteriota bacterium]
MKTVTYLTRRSALRRGSMGVVGSLLLARAQWADAVELPLVRWVRLAHPRLPPAFDGLRIAQIADVHAGTFMPAERLTRVRELVESLDPDLVVFTGDQLDRRDVDAEIFVHGFAGLQAPMGVFGVLGNHDHVAGRELSVAALQAVGAVPLVNDAVVIEQGPARIILAGVDDIDADPPNAPDFDVVNRHEADLRVLLCHQPNGWPAARVAGADITLSGHTHGGQITIPSRGLNVARLHTPFVAGPYRKGDYLLHVSRGIGVGAVPVRFGAMPEVDLITIERGPVSAAAV